MKKVAVGPRPEKTWPQYVAAFMINELAGIVKQHALTMETVHTVVTAEQFGSLLRTAYDGFLDRQQLRRILHFLLGGDLNGDVFEDVLCWLKVASWRAAQGP